MQTNPDDFEIKDSTISGAGLGVFSKVDIPGNSFLHVKPFDTTVGVVRSREDIPEEYITYCIARGDGTYLGPSDFDSMEPVWYLNHSNTPNAEQRKEGYFSLGDIPAGSEVTIDYNTLGEPEDKKEAFYRS